MSPKVMADPTGSAPSPASPPIQEARWPAILGILAIAGLQFALPGHLRVGPNWLMLAVVAALEVPIIVAHRAGRNRLNQRLAYLVLVLITAALVVSLARLIAGVIGHADGAKELLAAAAGLWFSTVLTFAAWYWRLDAGGPHIRDTRHFHDEGAFLFPPMTMDHKLRDTLGLRQWRPGFIDYVFLSFNTSTAFSPTDTPVLSRWAKVLTMIQAAISLSTVGILAARAVNVL